ncbi:aldehyde dehydrogenase family protein [Altericroceibacterium endophyticum]|uniref:aldehyde dehydrogenase (NAD(+)) n=1 Tax=Altericroceibacterium endophyticum TaxID=1808508 RepID=A0A6I4T8H7_9SPHN|nr:aldehyde dehydrogenase family protein [Altericroceibacterium endophyticum]MXO66055.1 aldehyde dehydrogenase family protein [Altericroceibacterium endophyticum]
MNKYLQHYIGGHWVDSEGSETRTVINPATEDAVSEVVMGTAGDVDKAVQAAKQAFPSYSQSTKEERLALLKRIQDEYAKRVPDIAQAITEEMGCPINTSSTAQSGAGLGHIASTINALENFEMVESTGDNRVMFEAAGIVALITPWNWPMNQIVAKVAPAIAAGNCVILKPSEQTPGSAQIFAEVLDAAGVPAGVFNLVQGDGPGVGTALAQHPGIDMISFTGSTRAGIQVAKNAADTVKRVHQELGGKSPFIVLPGTPLDKALPAGAGGMLLNSGQSCVAPTRFLIQKDQYDDAVKMLADIFGSKAVADPSKEGDHIGPVVNKAQYDKIQNLIEAGIKEGATVATGGLGRPEGLEKGYYVQPTILANVSNDMTPAREEIFGPVLVVIPYDDVDEAVEIANDTPYGLGAYIAGDPSLAVKVAPRIRAGSVFINSGGLDFASPFGGYKQSGNGREFGKFGLEEFMEKKALIGDIPA